MPSHLSSPPLRQPRSPHTHTHTHTHGRPSPARTQSVPPPVPIPTWDTPITLPMTRSKHVLSPHRAAPPPPQSPAAPSLPPMPYSISSPPPIPTSPYVNSRTPSSISIARSLSSSSSSSASSSYSQDIATPSSSRRASQVSASAIASPRTKSSKLLPALPLSINTQLTPQQSKGKRVAVDYSNSPIGLGIDEGQVVISREREREPRSRSRAQSVSRAYPTPPTTGMGLSLDSTNLDPSPSLSRSPKRRSTPLNTTPGGAGGTPPRPARRSSALAPSPSPSAKRASLPSPRRGSFTPSSNDLLPPRPDYARSISPSGDSISTISPATTPRPLPVDQADIRAAPPFGHILASAVEEPTMTPLGGRKRDSAQRRLSALRGLMANLDFNQPWSLSDTPRQDAGLSSTEEETFEPADQRSWPHEAQHSDEFIQSFIVSSSSEESLASPVESISLPLPLVRTGRPVGIVDPDIADSHGWPVPALPPKATPITSSPEPCVNITPVRRNSFSRRQPSSTPPRRPRQFRSSSELLSRTPEPPRPTARPRKEVFDVASSGYSKSLEPASPTLPATPTSTWRSTLSSDEVYHRLMQTHGPVEIKRQEVMWEMCETEQSFIKSMRTVLRLFATPLKTPQGKWIDGIPPKIADLFDSLEGIALAHGNISASERDMRRRTEVFEVCAFVTMFKSWVNRLQVHEWYLLKFEAVVQEVEENVKDPDSVFGEFVRMQMKEEVLGSMSLGSMLLKPVQRLTKYPLFLKRLLDVTPHPHPAHPEILSLLSSTESIILTLQATKGRQEDLEQLQSLEGRLHGLPAGFTLAVTGRKLIGQGLVSRVQRSKDIAHTFAGRGRANSLHSSRGSISSTVSSSAPSTASSISPWDFSASLTPSTCRTSAFSVSSNGSSFSAGAPSRSGSIKHVSPSISGISTFSASPSRVTRSPSSASSFAFADHHHYPARPTTPSSTRSSRKKEEPLTMLVFDDLVILAQCVSEKGGLFQGKRKGEKVLRVLSEVEGGIGKVAEVKDWSGWNGHSSLFSLTVVPISHSTRNPQSPITHVFTLSSTVTSSPSSTSLLSLRSSNALSSSSSPNTNNPTPTMISSLHLTCSTLNSMMGFITTLTQATTAATCGGVSGSAGRESEYTDDKEVEVLQGDWTEGYAS